METAYYFSPETIKQIEQKTKCSKMLLSIAWIVFEDGGCLVIKKD
jgi:hypothetical protein